MSLFSHKLYRTKLFFSKAFSTSYVKFFSNKPEFDLDYICNPRNSQEIDKNVKLRKGVGDVYKVLQCYKSLKKVKELGKNELHTLDDDFFHEISLLPNRTHPSVVIYGEEPKVIKTINNKPDFGERKPLDFADITKKLNIMRTDRLGHMTGSRSYYFMSELAELEEALIKYSLSRLIANGYNLISVPDILPGHVIEGCGANIKQERHQVYSLDALYHGPDKYLSGTAEMSLAGFLEKTTHKEEQLPLRLAAVSRCYRAEISNLLDERGIYRVHEFTKVEMFIVSKPEDSEAMLEEIRNIQEGLFSDLELHLRVLDMPPTELGAPAYRKYDIETWMPGRDKYGEISSCSNCTDYQARRLHIKYEPTDGSTSRHVHTLNGTACAVPRMLIALLETHQTADGKIKIPVPLQKYFSNREFITRTKLVPNLKISKETIHI